MVHFIPTDALAAGLGDWTRRPGPRYLRLADALETWLHAEPPGEGARLPSERAHAAQHGLSRGTVVAAYAALADRGVVERRQGSGTRVAAGVPWAAAGPSGPPPHFRLPSFSRFIHRGDATIDLSFGAPQLDDVVARLHARVADALHAGASLHGYAPLGLPALRAAIADRLTARAVPAETDNVVVTTGAQSAIALLTAALVRPGDRVVVEAPTYPGAMELFARAGAHVVAVERDHTGPRPDELSRALARGAALVFLVPTCHNPTGAIMHEARRRELLAVCREHGVPLLEDETTAEVVFDGAPPPAIASLDAEHVITVGSFSKILWGGLRVGFIRAPRELVLRLGRIKAAQDMGSGALDQLAVLAAMPDLASIGEHRRTTGKERHDALREALAAELPDWHVPPAKGGFSLWARLPHGTGDDLAAAALAQGVAVSPGSSSAPEDRFLDHVRLCFSAPPDELREAARRLAIAWERLPETNAGRAPAALALRP
jgi:DNA-binding transcriptional MocR family regulator